MTREEKLQKAHQMFDKRNLLIELKWQREYFKRGYVSNQEELFNLWIFDECIKALEQEPKTGHWIAIDEEPHEDYECDRCGYAVSTYTANIEPHTEYKFCPNCGTKMEGEE